MKTGLLLAVLVYASLLLGAGLLFRRRLEGLEGFFLASRSLGAPRVAFTLCASWIGAASLLVSTDEAYRDGLSAFWIIGLPAVLTLLILLPLAGRIRATTGSSLSDLMEARYGPAARHVTTVLIIWYMTVLAASQMAAAGSFLGGLLGTSPVAGLALAAGLVLVYSGAGGFPALSRIHVVQFLLLLAGVTGMIVSLGARSPWAEVRAAAARLGKSSYFDLLAGADRNLLIAVSFVLAWTISPIAWQRIQAAKGERSARRGLAGAAAALALFYSGIVVAGMLFLTVHPGGAPGRPLVTVFISLGSGPVLGGLLFVTVLAAILSTMDAAVNAGALTLTGGLLRLRRGRGGAGRTVTLARVSTALIAAAAFLTATRLGDILKTLGLASKIMAEGLFVPGLAALFMRRKAPWAGLLGLLCGGGYALLCFLDETGAVSLSLPAWPWSLPLGVGLSAAGFLAGFVLTFSRKWIKGYRARREK
jgi:solute:Na+ symporter, SSS family